MGSAASTLSPRADTLQSSYITLITDTCARDAQFKASLLASLGAPGGTTVQEHVQATDTAAFTDEGDGLSYRMKAETTDGRQMSLWHDVPLKHKDSDGKETGYLNFVCEIPKWTKKKFEIATDEVNTPIKQDEKKGVLREFKTGAAGLMMNYGCFPQTWEDPEFVHPDLKEEGVGGDNDPLDVCEIGMRQIPSGAVKVIGVLCMIDEGEADWKVIVIDAGDEWAKSLDSVEDLEKKVPGCVHSIREWFRDYKVADGKPQNKFGLGERCETKEYAMEVVEECNEAWLKLLSGEKVKSENEAITNLSVQHRPSMINLSADQMQKLQKGSRRASMDQMEEEDDEEEEGA